MRLSIFAFLAALFTGSASLFAAPFFDLIELNVPGQAGSASKAINDNNEIVGTVPLENSHALGFHWKDGVVTTLPAFDGNSVPDDINNRGEIVGYTRVNNVPTAWHRSAAGVDRHLPGWEAYSINNLGDILGRMGNAAYLLSAEPPVRLTPDAGMPAMINDARAVIGTYANRAFLSRDFQPFEQAQLLWPNLPESYQGSSRATAISPNGKIAGTYHLHYYSWQPAVWTGTEWRILGGRLHWPPYPNAVNSAGVIVGSDANAQRAILWAPNGLAYSLEHLVDMPPGAALSSGNDINENGWIAATSPQRGAVALKPIASLDDLPVVELVTPAQPILYSPNVTASIKVPRPGAALESVTYYLYTRTRSDNFNAGPDNVHFSSWGPSTNIANTAPFSFTFENLEPGQYVVSVQARDQNGLTIYLPPKHFVVTGAAEMKALRQRFDGSFDFGLRGAPGRRFRLETSTDLLEWTRLDLPPTIGGNFHFQNGPVPRFYRAMLEAEDPEIFHRGYSLPHVPTYPGASRIELMVANAKTPIVIERSNNWYRLNWPDRNWVNVEGEGEYLWGPFNQTYRIATPEMTGELQLEMPIPHEPLPPALFRATVSTDRGDEFWSGGYTVYPYH